MAFAASREIWCAVMCSPRCTCTSGTCTARTHLVLENVLRLGSMFRRNGQTLTQPTMCLHTVRVLVARSYDRGCWQNLKAAVVALTSVAWHHRDIFTDLRFVRTGFDLIVCRRSCTAGQKSLSMQSNSMLFFTSASSVMMSTRSSWM